MRSVRLAAALLAVGLSGCATRQMSYVAPLSSLSDAQVVSEGVTDFLETQFSMASRTVILEPTPTSQGSNRVTPALVRDLRGKGFAVSNGVSTPGAHRLRYWITPMDQTGELVRLDIDGRIAASQFFARDSAGRLQSGGPFTVLRTEGAG